MIRYAALLLTALFVLSSCSDEATNPGTITVVQAKTGSTFTFDEYNTDTTTGAPIEESRDTSVHTILRTGISFLGKTNVSEVSMISSMDADTTYVNYETNGDVSIGYPGFSPSSTIWITFPVSSKTTTTVTLVDTSITYLGIVITAKVTATGTHVGTESLTVGGKSISVVKIKMTTLSKSTIAGVPSEESSDTYLYIAPSLGYLVKVDQQPMTVPLLGTKSEGSYSMLINYNLK